MAQKSGNRVKPPVHEGGGNNDNAADAGSQTKTTKQHLAEQHLRRGNRLVAPGR